MVEAEGMVEEGGECTDERELDRGRGKEDAAVAEGANNASRSVRCPRASVTPRPLQTMPTSKYCRSTQAIEVGMQR